MIISYDLRLLLADILHANSSMIITTMHLVLAPPNTSGKGPAMEELVKFLNSHDERAPFMHYESSGEEVDTPVL